MLPTCQTWRAIFGGSWMQGFEDQKVRRHQKHIASIYPHSKKRTRQDKKRIEKGSSGGSGGGSFGGSDGSGSGNGSGNGNTRKSSSSSLIICKKDRFQLRTGLRPSPSHGSSTSCRTSRGNRRGGEGEASLAKIYEPHLVRWGKGKTNQHSIPKIYLKVPYPNNHHCSNISVNQCVTLQQITFILYTNTNW